MNMIIHQLDSGQNMRTRKITKLNNLSPKHDYSKDNCYLIFHHNVKENQTVEVFAEWFDVNYGEKVLWLLIRERDNTKGKPKYRNIKFENIDQNVEIVYTNEVKT